MAADWIKVEKVTPDKPEIAILARKLGVSHGEAFLNWFRVYAWADSATANGRVPFLSLADGDTLSRSCPGTCAALASPEIGWLTEDDGCIVFGKWDRHNGKSAKSRALESEKKRKQRSNVPQQSGQTAGQKQGPEEEEEEDIPYPNPSCNKGGNFDPEAIDWDMVINRASWLASELKCKPSDRITVARIAVLMQTTLGDEQVSSAVAQSRVKKKPISYFITVMKAIATQGGWDWDATTKAIIVHGDVLDAIVPANSRKVAT